MAGFFVRINFLSFMEVLDIFDNEDSECFNQNTVGNVYDYQGDTSKHRIDNMQNREEE